jgi:hypothetical protein
MCLNYHLSTFAEAKAKPVAARPERGGTATRHCEPLLIKSDEAINVIAKGKARSNLVLDSGNSFEIASLTAFIRNDGCFTSLAMTIEKTAVPRARGTPK